MIYWQKNSFIHDFYCSATVHLAFHHYIEKPTKFFKGGVSLPFIGSLLVSPVGALAYLTLIDDIALKVTAPPASQENKIHTYALKLHAEANGQN